MSNHDPLDELFGPQDDPRVGAALRAIGARLQAPPDELTARRHRRAIAAARPMGPVGIIRRSAMAGAAAAVAVLVLAAGGLLPAPAQQAIADVAARVGIDLPQPRPTTPLAPDPGDDRQERDLQDATESDHPGPAGHGSDDPTAPGTTPQPAVPSEAHRRHSPDDRAPSRPDTPNEHDAGAPSELPTPSKGPTAPARPSEPGNSGDAGPPEEPGSQGAADATGRPADPGRPDDPERPGGAGPQHESGRPEVAERVEPPSRPARPVTPPPGVGPDLDRRVGRASSAQDNSTSPPLVAGDR